MILFLHGFLGAKEDWNEVLAHLPGHQAICLDLPHPEELTDLVDRCGVAPVHLVGYSMGGRIALRLAEIFPNRWEKIVLIGAHLGLSQPEERAQRLLSDEQWAQQLEMLPLEAVLASWYEQPLFAPLRAKREIFEKMVQRRLLQDPSKNAQLLREWSLGNFPPAPLLSNMHFLYGEEDTHYAAHYEQRLPAHLQATAIPGCGHAPHIEAPVSLAAAILQLLTHV